MEVTQERRGHKNLGGPARCSATQVQSQDSFMKGLIFRGHESLESSTTP